MAKTKRNAPRTLSTQAEIQVEIQDPLSIEPTGAPNPPFIQDSEVQTRPPIEPTDAEIEDHLVDETTQNDDENPRPTRKRKTSSKYWPVDVIDKDGVVQEASLAAKDLFAKLRGRKVILEWNKFLQPVGEAAGLLGQHLGELAANFENFPIWYTSWPDVPGDYKDKIWSDIKSRGYFKSMKNTESTYYKKLEKIGRIIGYGFTVNVSAKLLVGNKTSRIVQTASTRKTGQSFYITDRIKKLCLCVNKMQKIEKNKLFPIHLVRNQLLGNGMSWKKKHGGL